MPILYVQAISTWQVAGMYSQMRLALKVVMQKLQGLFAGNQYLQRTPLREKRSTTVNPTVIFHAMTPIYVRNMTVRASYRAVASRHNCTDRCVFKIT
jgi:hypothetical protein